jgi:hypothetical protein
LTSYILIVNNHVDNIVGVSVANIVARSTLGAGNIQQHRATVAVSIYEIGSQEQ